MKTVMRYFSWTFALACCLALSAFTRAAESPNKLRVLVVIGGHDFETNHFNAMFASQEGISFQVVEHPKAQAHFKADAASQYDVIFLYDMWQNISDEAKTDFANLLKSGKGLVATHHCLASYQAWDEYSRIIGGKYHLKPHQENGVEKPGSTYQHDVDFKVEVADPNHPVTRGVSDFQIHDETYGKFSVMPGVKPLLTTKEPTSTDTIGWAHNYGKARVVYLELGHDHQAWENPNYRKLVRQSLFWAAGK